MSHSSNASSLLLGAAAVMLGDSGGDVLRMSAVSEADVADGDLSDIGVEIVDHLGSFLGSFLPTVAASLDLATGSADVTSPVNAGDLSETINALTGGNLLRLVLPGGGERLGGLDPTTTVLQSVSEGGVLSSLVPNISSSELASLARTGSGPILVTLLAVEAGIAQILERLQKIEGKIDEILRGMERERGARMRGTIAYLSDITSTIRIGNLNAESVTSFSGELENTDREARGFSEEYRAILNERIDAFEELDIAGANLDIEDDVTTIRGAMVEVEGAARGLLLSLSIRMITMRVRALLPVEQESTRQRIERLNREIDELLEVVKKAEKIMDQKAGDVHGIRQEVVQKTGTLLGGAGKLAGKMLTPRSLGGKLAKGLADGAADLVGDAIGKVGRLLEGADGVEKAHQILNEEFASFTKEITEAVEGIREDGHIVERVREKRSSEPSEVVLDLSVGEDGRVYMRS